MKEQKKRIAESVEIDYGFSVHDLKVIKQERVFLLQTKPYMYIVKRFRQREKVDWQVRCLKQLQQKRTRGLIPFIANKHQKYVHALDDGWYALMPFIPGAPVDVRNKEHLHNCMKLLGYFHHQGQYIYGKSQMIPFHSHILDRWRKRSQRFERSLKSREKTAFAHEGLMRTLRQVGDTITDWAAMSLDHLPEAYMLYLEEQAQRERQIAHLDVAPHNFLSLQPGAYYMLDYDLLDYAPPLFDVIQFLSRVLPYHQWSFSWLQKLVRDYTLFAGKENIHEHVLYAALIYPHDLIREWLGVWERKPGFHPQRVWHYFQQASDDWLYREQFVQHCRNMLK